ncbi:hypothetical protein BJ508DRAFT_313349 [Ascobolus immersus RN42]|uniref:Uncharacterized protein n=1 Tax=Ascobolus immersus RN42 TaxID=1160509 RepID=A0A3N4HPC7_ASCIM|nr:hypothetical protein BJ508DRAFT_313349 [Ascobolus immersus RN42]
MGAFTALSPAVNSAAKEEKACKCIVSSTQAGIGNGWIARIIYRKTYERIKTEFGDDGGIDHSTTQQREAEQDLEEQKLQDSESMKRLRAIAVDALLESFRFHVLQDNSGSERFAASAIRDMDGIEQACIAARRVLRAIESELGLLLYRRGRVQL